ncbi:MAG: site-specific DNA-methyltransferase [Planctomycetota bacterium]
MAKKKTTAKRTRRSAKAPKQGQAGAGGAARSTSVEVAAAKGRPMLTWVGKRPLTQVTAFPAQPAERHLAQDIVGLVGDDSDAYRKREGMFQDLRDQWNADRWQDLPDHVATPESGGLLLHGDNKECLAWLLANGYRGKVDLIYIDPPFDSGADYVRKVSLRGAQGGAKIEGETYTLGEQIQYTDIWANDNYLQFMYERLLLMKELLSPHGTIFLHCDNRRAHHLRCLLDEVFGAENFINEIVWQHQIMGGSHEKRFPKAHETLLWYAKGSGYRLRSESHEVRVPFSDYVLKTLQRDEDGRLYYERRRMSRKATAAEAASKAHTRTYVDDPQFGTVATDVWTDLLSYQELPNEREGLDLYPTQKTSKLLKRIVAAATDPGDLVLDCFAGAGVALKAAQGLGRRWIGCDINKGAIQTTAKRIRRIVAGQIETARSAKKAHAGRLIAEPDDDAPKPCQFGFHVLRVNDYDLQIQHNEAVNLACEHIGVQRTRTDAFFDGTRGRKLVKVVPFDHPLSPVDLEEVRKELDSRPDEDRSIIMVCLGIELAARTWLEEWNRRRGKAVNKIEAIELRSDPQYGRFIQHHPATARVAIVRKNGRVSVKIEDFVSPSIVERLQQQAGVVAPKIDDWRAMVDCVMIDTAYDGEVFNVVLADIPERKPDYVAGTYDLPAPADEKSTVAVKIVDMLGEEVIETKTV